MHALFDGFGPWTPWVMIGVFLAASFLMIWRLDALSENGFEGTVLGTLIMPYCSGVGNVVFAVLLGTHGGSGADVLVNSLVNNVTNLTLLLGLPALIWGLNLLPSDKPATAKRKPRKNRPPSPEHQINRLSLLLTLVVVLFFTGALWALARDGRIDLSDGLVLVGLFVFWQAIHVFEVLKSNARENRSLGGWLVLDLGLLAVGAFWVYASVDWLVGWVERSPGGWFDPSYLGWWSGALMVLPNATMALYYAARGRADVTYSSQVGDGHICIPLCVGLFALFRPIQIPAFFDVAVMVLAGAGALHLVVVGLFGGLPRWIGAGLIVAYGYFLYAGLIGPGPGQ